MTNARESLSQFRRLQPQEAEALGISPKAERRISPTGEIITRRQYEDIRAQAIGYRNLTAMQRGTREAKTHGFTSAAQWRALHGNEMYEALERIYSLNAGGIPEDDIRSFQPIADDFNNAMGAVIQSGEWRFRSDPNYAKFGAGLTYARLGPNVRRLFEVVGVGADEADAQKRADWLRLY